MSNSRAMSASVAFSPRNARSSAVVRVFMRPNAKRSLLKCQAIFANKQLT